MRRALALGVVLLGVYAAEPAAAASFTTFVSNKNPAVWNGQVRFTAFVANDDATPAVGAAVSLVGPAGVLATGVTDADGRYAATIRVRRPGDYLAEAVVGPDTIQSAPVTMRVTPRVGLEIHGTRIVGASLVARGRVRPVAAVDKLRLRLHGETRRVRVSRWGYFKAPLATKTVARLRGAFGVVPNAGYTRKRRSFELSLRRPYLALGSRSVAVRALERRLKALHHVLSSRPDGYFGVSTYQAVVAFQKVHGLARTGRVDESIWSKVTNARVPRAFIPSGTHIEVSKTKQVMYEVVRGKVARIIHVSTGATGNTPVGDWRVYRLGPGGSLSHMYYSIYFLRGFAIHGYHSVPNYPASHGCVRTPLWFARSFYNRWGRIGVRIVVFP